MTRLENKLRTALARCGIKRTDGIVVGVSGGADSIALLHALVQWKGKVIVAHLNHGLRGEESDEDQAFVEEVSRAFDIPCHVTMKDAADYARTRKLNLESASRDLRYDFFRKLAVKCQAKFIFTAHTRDDQAETLLMQLVRGTGVAGWRGVHMKIEGGDGLTVVRPLLDVSRAEIIKHCEARGLGFRNDSSNSSLDFTRNRLRLNILPRLRELNPEFDQALISLAGEAGENLDLLQVEAERVVREATSGSLLKVAPLRAMPPLVRRLALRVWIRESRGHLKKIGRAHLESLDRLVTSSEGGSYVELPGGCRVSLHRGGLKLQPSVGK